ncbi:hypothetical protein JDV02_005660 [Purpureocillium takamizusanense]|uniref:Peptidase S26 domain-containing protein n=1 Tax=Purpureocillium takamizusanense TaxID=2060973 RepID=A0A9Q8QGJ3_9HYPO|nr:uncharacterized protein JDV02_005660 [Purpureocillium takamizusanense]UNI19478.1 hypothetical protein JDV02_005660 [Purpureocillium takamizusanense]
MSFFSSLFGAGSAAGAAAAHPLRLAISTLKATCLAHLAFTHLVQLSPASGPSMLPTFSVHGDWIAADMTARRGGGISSSSSGDSSGGGGSGSGSGGAYNRLRVGDLVLYKIPISDSQHGVKRLVGLPGDYVSLGTPGEDGEEQMIQVPQGHCWIVGDNLPASRDSRQFGPLPLALVQGKIIAKVLPWRERHWIRNGLDPVPSPGSGPSPGPSS